MIKGTLSAVITGETAPATACGMLSADAKISPVTHPATTCGTFFADDVDHPTTCGTFFADAVNHPNYPDRVPTYVPTANTTSLPNRFVTPCNNNGRSPFA